MRIRSIVLLRVLHILNHLAVVLWVLGGGQILGWNLAYSVMIYVLLGCFGISLGYHRYLSHRSFRPRTFFEGFMLWLGMISCGGSPLAWASAHRYHHLNADSDKDIHSVSRDGWFKVYFHLWRPFYIKPRLIKDLLLDKKIIFLHRYYFLLIGVWAALFYSVSFETGVFFFSLPAVLSFHFYGLINVLGHSFGHRPLHSPDTATNHWFVNLFVFGEGWHQNHHLAQSCHRIGLRAGEFDISAWLIENIPFSHDWQSLKKRSQQARTKILELEYKKG